MDYAEAIDIISELFRISHWASNEYGERYAVLDNDIDIRVSQSNSDTLVLQGMFGEVIPTGTVSAAMEHRLSYLLQANFIRIIHEDDILAIDRQLQRLSITRNISLMHATFESLTDDVEAFIKSMDFWDMALQRKSSMAVLSPLLSFSLRR